MSANRKIGGQGGNVNLPSSTTAFGSFTTNEQYRFSSLGEWPRLAATPFVTTGEYVFAASSGVVTSTSGTDNFLPALGGVGSRTVHSDLFAKIGVNYGSGNGSTTFTLPNISNAYSYLKAEHTLASGVYSSGVLPRHTHTYSLRRSAGNNTRAGDAGNQIVFPIVEISGDFTGDTYINAKAKDVIPMIAAKDQALPAGFVCQYILPLSVDSVATVLPSNVLIASGQAISRTTYSGLFTRLGTLYGNGDGSTTFNLPDYRGVFLRGPQGYTSLQPSGLTTGSGYALDGFARHRHTIAVDIAVPQPGGNSVATADYNSPNFTSPSTSNSDIGGVETRPQNVYCLNCIVVL